MNNIHFGNFTPFIFILVWWLHSEFCGLVVSTFSYSGSQGFKYDLETGNLNWIASLFPQLLSEYSGTGQAKFLKHIFQLIIQTSNFRSTLKYEALDNASFNNRRTIQSIKVEDRLKRLWELHLLKGMIYICNLIVF